MTYHVDEWQKQEKNIVAPWDLYHSAFHQFCLYEIAQVAKICRLVRIKVERGRTGEMDTYCKGKFTT